jgi:DNA-binding SARP family transcriptional activator/tetratricopeptide (TPR) repeat protein
MVLRQTSWAGQSHRVSRVDRWGSNRMEFRLFGELRLRADGRSLDVGTPRQQIVLAALVVDAGRPVPIETLVDRLWDADPPAEARNILYSHLSRIRRLLAPTAARLDRRSAGYVLDVDPDRVDLHRFTRLVERSRTAGGVERADLLADALALWRGPPLAGLAGEWADRLRAEWQRRRLDAAVAWAEAELDLNRTDAVLTTLPELAAEYPLAEPLEGLLMRALHAAGRDAEALRRYAALRQRLADELGADPGPALQALHTALLRGELPTPARRGGLLATPAQLPPDVHGFAGRDAELRVLDELAGNGAGGARIAAVSGTAGVGKTSLVVHWAHRVRDRFPGGQLFVNLRGFAPTGAPMTPAEAMRAFLDAFEVPLDRIPAGFEAQVGLFRSLLAERRVLVVLDNARDVDQVRSLLPGAPGCLVLVTSRTLLSGLVAAGARPVTVDLLGAGEARALLVGRLGAARVSAEPHAATEIVELCARLPLALAVVAARAATYPTFALTDLADELRAARGSLDEFADADPATDPRAVFSWSYRQLTDAAARLFRLLGRHAGPDIGTRAAASLAGLPVGRTRPLLHELARANLVAEHSPGRYTCHDLLRTYASELDQATTEAEDRRAATRRLLAYYIHSANNADAQLDPRRDPPPPLVPLPPEVDPDRPADLAAALAWFNAERRVLVTAVHQDSDVDAEVWQLVWGIRRFLANQGHWPDELTVLRATLPVAARLGDVSKQAFVHCYLGATHVWLAQHDDAHRELATAAELYQASDDLVGQGHVQFYLAWLREREERNDEAHGHAERALEFFSLAGHPVGEARSLNAVGWFHALAGDYGTAISYCEKALDLQTKLGDDLAAALTWHSIGYAHDRLGDHVRAIACYQAAFALDQRAGHRYGEALMLRSLGESHRDNGDLEAARAAWQQAVEIYDQLGHPDGDDVRAELASLNTTPTREVPR